MTSKADLRAAALAARDAISPHERQRLALAVADHGDAAIKIAPGQVVSGFLPILSEIDATVLMQRLEARGARLCLPAIIDRQTIVFRAFDADTALEPGGFGTRQPGAAAAICDPDIMLMPLAGFDGAGNRLGYGAGHYDRAVARLREKGRDPLLIGLAFGCQQVDAIPAEAHDIGLDAILTEHGICAFSARAKMG